MTPRQFVSRGAKRPVEEKNRRYRIVKDVVGQEGSSCEVDQIPKKQSESRRHKEDADGQASLERRVEKRLTPTPFRMNKTDCAIHRDKRVGENSEIAEKSDKSIGERQSFREHAGEGDTGLENQARPGNRGHQTNHDAIAVTHSIKSMPKAPSSAQNSIGSSFLRQLEFAECGKISWFPRDGWSERCTSLRYAGSSG